MAQAGATGGWRPPVSIRVLQGLALGLVSLKLILICITGPFMDEAYYWMWGQHPSLSYYDHPPLNAWLQGLASTLLGWAGPGVALRAMVVVALIGDGMALHALAKRVCPENAAGYFWLTLVLFLSTPIFIAVTAVALPDHIMVLGGLWALYFLVRFFQGWEEGQAQPGYRDLYLGALCAGLATLAKYNGALIGIGVAVFIIVSPRYRPLLRSPQLYGAALIGLVVQTPVLVWNLSNGLASFGFILWGRHVWGQSAGGHDPLRGMIDFGLGAAIFLSPTLLWPIGRLVLAPMLARRRSRDGAPERGGLEAGLGRAIFIVSTLAFGALALVTPVMFHWNLMAYIAVLPFLALFWSTGLGGRLLLGGQVSIGALFVVGLMVNYAGVPILALTARGDEASAWAYDWPDTAALVRARAQEHQVAFIATPDYTTAALLGLALNDRHVVSLGAKTDQFDFWFDKTARIGQNALILADRWRPMTGAVQAQFQTLNVLDTHEVRRFGVLINTYTIYLAEKFEPAP